MNAGHKFLGPVKYNLENFIFTNSTTRFTRSVRVVGIANQLLLNWIELGINIDSHLSLNNRGRRVAIWWRRRACDSPVHARK